jgi:hypothetical protein
MEVQVVISQDELKLRAAMHAVFTTTTTITTTTTATTTTTPSSTSPAPVPTRVEAIAVACAIIDANHPPSGSLFFSCFFLCVVAVAVI